MSLAKGGLYGFVAILSPLESELFALGCNNLWLIRHYCHLCLVQELEGDVRSALVADEKLVVVD